MGRRCKVKNRDGYFHCWENYSEPLPAGLTIGSTPAGVFSCVFGIVEMEDGSVERVEPEDIIFCDKN